jgi:hypothetical protein
MSDSSGTTPARLPPFRPDGYILGRMLSHHPESQKLMLRDGNIVSWLGGLRLYLKSKGIDYVLTTPWPEYKIDSTLEEFNAHFNYYGDTLKASKIMFAILPPHLQEEFKDDWAYDIHRKICKMYAKELTQDILDNMNDPNEIACTLCCEWGHVNKNCLEYLQKLNDEESNGFGSTSGIKSITNSLFTLILNKRCG